MIRDLPPSLRQPLSRSTASQGQQLQGSCQPDPSEHEGVEDPSGSREVQQSKVGDGHFDEADAVYRLVSRRRYEAGDQVFLCYGRHTNLELLEHYGFMLDDNPHGAFCLYLPSFSSAQ